MAPTVTDVNGDELSLKRQRGSYDAPFKVELIDMCNSGKYSTNAQALAVFNKKHSTKVTAGTMSKWLSQEETLRRRANDPSLRNKKHAKESDLLYVEASLKWWFFQMHEKKGAVLTDDLLAQQALAYEDIIVQQFTLYGLTELAKKYEAFTASSGYISKFKLRYAVHSSTLARCLLLRPPLDPTFVLLPLSKAVQNVE